MSEKRVSGCLKDFLILDGCLRFETRFTTFIITIYGEGIFHDGIFYLSSLMFVQPRWSLYRYLTLIVEVSFVQLEQRGKNAINLN